MPNNQSQNQPQQGEDSIHLENLEARTMRSDIESIQNQGGGEPKPYIPKEPVELSQGEPQKEVPPPQMPGAFPPLSEGGGGFTNEQFVPPPSQQITPEQIMGEEYPPKKSNKKTFVIALIVIIGVGLGATAYFIFLPSGPISPATPLVEPQPSVGGAATETPAEIEVPAVPTEEGEVEGSATSVPEEVVEEPSTTTGIPAKNHISLLKTAADTVAEINLPSLDLASFASALDFSPTEVPFTREVVFVDQEGNLVKFGDLASLLSPTVFSPEVAELFEPDATFFTYTNQDGTWFGLVAKLKEGADQSAAKNQIKDLETNLSEVKNFFLENPGAENTWKDGRAGTVSSRYITFTKKGSAFNYGWSGNLLIIGTSYPAFQEVINRL